MTDEQYGKVGEFPYYTSSNPDLSQSWYPPHLKLVNIRIKKNKIIDDEYCIYEIKTEDKHICISNYNRYYSTEIIRYRYNLKNLEFFNKSISLQNSPPIKLTHSIIDLIKYLSHNDSTFYSTIGLMVSFHYKYNEIPQLNNEKYSLFIMFSDKLKNLNIIQKTNILFICYVIEIPDRLVNLLIKYYTDENDIGNIVNVDFGSVKLLAEIVQFSLPKNDSKPLNKSMDDSKPLNKSMDDSYQLTESMDDSSESDYTYNTDDSYPSHESTDDSYPSPKSTDDSYQSKSTDDSEFEEPPFNKCNKKFSDIYNRLTCLENNNVVVEHFLKKIAKYKKTIKYLQNENKELNDENYEIKNEIRRLDMYSIKSQYNKKTRNKK